jgi:uncharacterized Zn finger protein
VIIKKDKTHCPIYHMPGEYICPECGGWNQIGRDARKHFEKCGSVGVECGQCGTVKFWYKIPDPREPRERRMQQIYWSGEDE